MRAFEEQRRALSAVIESDLSPAAIISALLAGDEKGKAVTPLCEEVINQKEAAEREREFPAAEEESAADLQLCSDKTTCDNSASRYALQHIRRVAPSHREVAVGREGCSHPHPEEAGDGKDIGRRGRGRTWSRGTRVPG